jgi:hypothetical protein
VTDVATYSFSYPLGNGQNFFTIIATDEQILTTTINAPGGSHGPPASPESPASPRRRIQAAAIPRPGASAPEPATVLLLGLACASMAPFALKRRKAGTLRLNRAAESLESIQLTNSRGLADFPPGPGFFCFLATQAATRPAHPLPARSCTYRDRPLFGVGTPYTSLGSSGTALFAATDFR